jgi:hypothetical protein
MFVGISVSELLSWYGSSFDWMLPIIAGLSAIHLVGLPLLEFCWTFVDRREFKNVWFRWTIDLLWEQEWRKEASRISTQNSDMFPAWFLTTLLLGFCVVVWPVFILLASLILPLYLLRAARDGQKLAIKVKNHIADKEAHKGE